MKKYILLLSLFASTLAYGQNNNYISVRTMLDPNQESYLEDIQYYDGLGREWERAELNRVYENKNFYKMFLQEYDSLGRPAKQWLPAGPSDGFLEPESYKKMTSSFNYGNDKVLFTHTKYESSPLNRIIEVQGPGDAWQGHPMRMSYATNTLEDSLCCTSYTIQEDGILKSNGKYSPAELSVTKVIDEDNRTTYTFTDKEGRKVMDRQTNGNEQVDTYYIYNAMGQLCMVLPPMINGNISQENLDKYAYQYKYDAFGRCNWKKLPGCGAVKYVYDFSDRIILT